MRNLADHHPNGRRLSDSEHAAIIRGKLKAAGITSRQVSVRVTTARASRYRWVMAAQHIAVLGR